MSERGRGHVCFEEEIGCSFVSNKGWPGKITTRRNIDSVIESYRAWGRR